jgi:hypothetical protein
MGLVYEDDQVSLGPTNKTFSATSGNVDTEKLLTKVRLHAEALLD